jgi:GTP-binding protein HflX
MASKLIFGKTSGLSAKDIERIERLHERVVSPPSALTAEFAQLLCGLAFEMGRHIGVLVDRRGHVAHVALGDGDMLYLPDLGRSRGGTSRLRGLRLIVARPKNKGGKGNAFTISKDFITDLEKLRLDAVIQIELSPAGALGRVALAHLVAEQEPHHKILHFANVSALKDFDLNAIVEELESRFFGQHSAKNLRKVGDRDSAVLVGVYTTPKKIWEPHLRELRELAKTASVHVVDTVVQQRKAIDPRTIVGSGKLQEIALAALHQGAEMLIFDCDLSPSQLNAITDLTELKVIDRTMLILDIFARRAKSRSGRMQVELAQLRYSLPRLAKKQSGLSRLTGGIGGQGPGETKLEIDRRRVKDKVAKLEREIEELRGEHALRRKSRKQNQLPIISIVGYTNAGKSTLLNALTGADAYVKDELFATLDPTSRRLRFPHERDVIITDTVGFIEDLPEGLMNAFRATLEELEDADVLLQVIDGTDERCQKQADAVSKILEALKLNDKPRVIVLNKCDDLDPVSVKTRCYQFDAIPISAVKKTGFPELLKALAYELWHEGKDMGTGSATGAYSQKSLQ